MIVEMIASQIMFWGIVIFSIFIAYEFYLSKNGKLRVLIIELFIAKGWAYGVAGIYYFMWDLGYYHGFDTLYLRLVCNLPMFYVMLRLYKFIRLKN